MKSSKGAALRILKQTMVSVRRTTPVLFQERDQEGSSIFGIYRVYRSDTL